MATITSSLIAALDGVVGERGVGSWHVPYFNEEMGTAVEETHDADVISLAESPRTASPECGLNRTLPARGRGVRQVAPRHEESVNPVWPDSCSCGFGREVQRRRLWPTPMAVLRAPVVGSASQTGAELRGR
jgi:hypothetical protein